MDTNKINDIIEDLKLKFHFEFLKDEIVKMQEEKPEEFLEFENVISYINTDEDQKCIDVNGITDGLRYNYVVEDSHELPEDFSSLEEKNPYTPVIDWKYMDMEEVNIYVDSDIAECMTDDEKVLIILYKENTGEIPDASVWESVINGEPISDEIKAKLIYSVSKKAKSYRGWQFEKKDYDFRTRIKGKEHEEKYKYYYSLKDKLLEDIPVTELHYDMEQEILYRYRTLCTYKYHTFVEKCSLERAKELAEIYELPLKTMQDALYVDGVSTDSEQIYCNEFVELLSKVLLD